MNFLLRALAILAVILVGALLVGAIPASETIKPMYGVAGKFNAPMCGTNDYEHVQTKATEFAVNDSAGTCVRSEKYHADFAIASITKDISWQYPDIASGYVPEGETTCANPKQDTCFTYPVQAERDGGPVASFGSWLASGSYNESLDIWFSPVKSRHSTRERAGDTEIMIWTAYPGIDDRSHFIAYVTIDHLRFGIMTWEAAHQWRYVAYLWLNAPRVGHGRELSVRNLRLNPFFHNAEHNGWLSPSEWLWAIDLGFELRWGGTNDNIHGYSLTGVR